MVKIDPNTRDIVKRIFNMYLEGKSYYQISCILDEEKVLYPEHNKWTEAAVRTIINNRIDELKKLNKADCIDLAKPTEDMQGISVIKSTPRITKSELNEYIENLKEHYDVKYYEDVYDWTRSYIQEDTMKIPRSIFIERSNLLCKNWHILFT